MENVVLLLVVTVSTWALTYTWCKFRYDDLKSKYELLRAFHRITLGKDPDRWTS